MDITSNYFVPVNKRHTENLCSMKQIIFIQNIKPVRRAILSVDQDLNVNGSTELWLEKMVIYNFIFANGGNQNIPYSKTCRQLNVKLADSLDDKAKPCS